MAHPTEGQPPLTQSGVFVVGIGGATCSGKSSITKHLCDTLQHTVVVHQDDYWLDVNQIQKSPCGKYIVWDVLESLDMPKFLEALRKTISHPQTTCGECTSTNQHQEQQLPHITHTILVEGTMVLSIREVCEYLHAAFFVTMDFEECKQRRSVRRYGTSEGTWMDPPGHFEHVVWPGYLRDEKIAKDYQAAKDNPFSVCLIDGGKPINELQTDVESAIRGHLPTKQ